MTTDDGLSEIVRICRTYQVHYGLPVTIEPAQQRIMLPVSDFSGAVTMPADLGSLVKIELERQNMLGPIVAHPRSRTWTFICATHDDCDNDMHVYSALFRLYARISPRSSRIALPTPGEISLHYREWIVKPDRTLPPSMLTVVEATIAVGRRC